MRILGVDPGLRQMGWAVIEQNGQKIRQIGVGVVQTSAQASLSQRLCALHFGLSQVVEHYKPQEAAVEETFVNKDARSTLKLGQARAIALLVPAQNGLLVAEYAANQVKKTVTGAGHADKAQVEYMIRLQVAGASPENPDAADALAIALCHLFMRKNFGVAS